MSADTSRVEMEEAVIADLAPTGVLRVALNLGNPLLVQKDARTGKLGGVTVDMAHDMGRQVQRPVQFLEFDSAGKVSACARDNIWDVAFLAIDPKRAIDIEYTEPYVQIEGTYLVAQDSDIRSVSDVDVPGMQVAVGAGTAYDLFLTRHLKRAEIVRFDTSEQSLQHFSSHGIPVAAGIRQPLEDYAQQHPGYRVLEDYFTLIKQAVGCPRGRPLAAQFLCAYVQEAKRSGLVETGLRNSGQPAIFLPASPASYAGMAVQAGEGMSLHVKIEGPEEAPFCFVLLHSLGMDHTFWGRVAPVLSETARVVTLDLRGHGKSSKPKGPYKVGDMAADVRAVLDSINCTEVIVAGASMSGCVALQFAIDHPQRVRGLALIDTTAWYGPSAAEDWAQRAAKAQQDGFKAMVEFQQSRWFTEEFRRNHASEVRACTEVFLSNDMDGYVASCLALGAFDAREHLANIHTPTAVVVGEHDRATPVHMSQALHQAIPNSELTVVPSAKHLTPIEAPEAIIKALNSLAERAQLSQPSDLPLETPR